MDILGIPTTESTTPRILPETLRRSCGHYSRLSPSKLRVPTVGPQAPPAKDGVKRRKVGGSSTSWQVRMMAGWAVCLATTRFLAAAPHQLPSFVRVRLEGKLPTVPIGCSPQFWDPKDDLVPRQEAANRQAGRTSSSLRPIEACNPAKTGFGPAGPWPQRTRAGRIGYLKARMSCQAGSPSLSALHHQMDTGWQGLFQVHCLARTASHGPAPHPSRLGIFSTKLSEGRSGRRDQVAHLALHPRKPQVPVSAHQPLRSSPTMELPCAPAPAGEPSIPKLELSIPRLVYSAI